MVIKTDELMIVSEGIMTLEIAPLALVTMRLLPHCYFAQHGTSYGWYSSLIYA